MPRLSESVTKENFASTVAMLGKRVQDLIYLPSDDDSSELSCHGRFEALFLRFDDFQDNSCFHKVSFETAILATQKLDKALKSTLEALLGEKPTSDKDAQKIIKNFEQAVTTAMDENMPIIQATFSTGNEIYARIRPYLLPILEKLNGLYVELTGGVFFDEMLKTPTCEIQQDIKEKYALLTASLDDETPTSDDEKAGLIGEKTRK